MGGESLTTEDVGSAWLHVVASAPLYVVGGLVEIDWIAR